MTLSKKKRKSFWSIIKDGKLSFGEISRLYTLLRLNFTYERTVDRRLEYFEEINRLIEENTKIIITGGDLRRVAENLQRVDELLAQQRKWKFR